MHKEGLIAKDPRMVLVTPRQDGRCISPTKQPDFSFPQTQHMMPGTDMTLMGSDLDSRKYKMETVAYL